MQMIDNIISYLRIISVILVLFALAFSGLGYYILRVRHKRVVEKPIDYSQFAKADTLEYIKFDDVGENMLITDNGTRFVAAIKCTGIDFKDAEAEEKRQIMRGFITFINIIDHGRVQFRQSAKDVNLGDMLDDYKERLTTLNEKQYTLNLDYQELKAASEKEDIQNEEYDIYYEKLKEMQRKLMALGYQAEQLKAQIVYMDMISGSTADPETEEIYVFDWSYNQFDFSSSELSEPEIKAKAERQLRTKADNYISALRNAGVKARMMSGAEMMEIIRRYTHPISAAKYTVDDIVQSAYDSIAVTSNSLDKLEELVNKRTLDAISKELEEEVAV